MYFLLQLFTYRRKLFYVFIILLVIGVVLTMRSEYIGIMQGSSTKQANTSMLVSSLSDTEKTFESMKNNGWDVIKPLIYAYYFYDHNETKLTAFSKILQKNGFHIGILDKSASYSKDHLYLLYVTEITEHTPKSLLKQCQRLSNLAIKNHIEVFDGWEAGKTSLDGQSLSDYQD